MEAKYLRAKMIEEGRDVLPSCSFPGGYPLIYVAEGKTVLCNICATKVIDDITDYDCFMEGAPIECGECGEQIESAYGDPEEVQE